MDDQLACHQLLHHSWAGAITITTICVQYSTLLMATNSTPKAQWDDHEIAVLLQYLDNQKSQSEGVGNFKEPVWNNALEAIKDYYSRGPIKTAKMWNLVCCKSSDVVQ